MKVLKSALIGILSGASIFALTFFVSTTYYDFENKTYDMRFYFKILFRGKVKTINDIIIVDIDEKSLTKLGRFQPGMIRSIL